MSKSTRGRRREHVWLKGVEHTRCGTCKKYLPVTTFGSNKKNWDGLAHRCKPCANNDRIARYAANPEVERKRQRDYVAANRELVSQKAKEAYYADVDKSRARNRAKYANNSELLRENARLFRATPEGRAQTARDNARSRALNTERNRQLTADWFKRNPEYRSFKESQRRARKLGLPVESWSEAEIIERDGFVCWLKGCVLGGKLLDGRRDWAVDHLIPLNCDYPNHPGTVLANLGIACAACNSSKRNKLLPEAIARYEANLEKRSPHEGSLYGSPLATPALCRG